MSENEHLIYIDPMAEMIAQIRQEERDGARVDFAVAMFYGGEPDEKIAKYTRLDIERIREARAAWEDINKNEKDRMNLAINLRIGEYYRLGEKSNREQMLKRSEIMEMYNDRKRYLLQMLGADPGAGENQ